MYVLYSFRRYTIPVTFITVQKYEKRIFRQWISNFSYQVQICLIKFQLKPSLESNQTVYYENYFITYMSLSTA